MSRLSIEIEPEQHRQIKTLATFSGMTIKEFILSRTLSASKNKAVGMDTTEKLLSHPKTAAKLRVAMATPREEYVAFDTMKDLKNALGI